MGARPYLAWRASRFNVLSDSLRNSGLGRPSAAARGGACRGELTYTVGHHLARLPQFAEASLLGEEYGGNTEAPVDNRAPCISARGALSIDAVEIGS